MTKRALFLLSVASALGACAGTMATAALPAEATLLPGQRMTLPEQAWLEYIGTYDDSRCPPKVQCIRAGDARVALRIGDRDAVLDLALLASTQGQPQAAGRWRITLLDLAHGAAPKARLRVETAQ